jgi:hypothetical protein
MNITIKCCARCQLDHTVEFLEFKTPPPKYTHWAICPNTKEPILLWIEK